ncbi:MAG: site-specific DNA-methyltransferase [Deltaproteobacteria bacterium]|nr:site-specific DNA-methyltransferase [Deltaproteobacteria bacterium]
MADVEITLGDCVEVLRGLPDACIDAVVTDPPYGLSKEPDMLEVLRHWLAGDDYQHSGGGFMGKTWDRFVPGPSVWREVYRVLKPGGHVLSFSGTRTYDLMVTAIRIAGFEIRDQLAWMYGSGFPKSNDVGRDIDMTLCTLPGDHCDKTLSKKPGAHLCPAHPAGDPHRGKRTALKPAQEPIVLARKPLVGTVAANVLQHGTGGINVEACRIEMSEKDRSIVNSMGGFGRAGYESPPGTAWRVDGSLASVGAKAHDAGRWPANVLLDEDAAAMLDAQADASRFFYVAKASRSEREAGLEAAGLPIRSGGELTDREDGSAGLNSPRAGAGCKGGRRNHHPTVKPVALMRYLIRLITPPGGLVLDPFAGSGTTLVAAVLEGFDALGIEMTEDYLPIARARIAHAEGKKQ